MRKFVKTLLILFLIPAALFGVAGACLAAPIPSGFDVWDSRQTDDVLKSWTIRFNKPAASATVNKTSILITDVENRPLDTVLILSGDGTSVTIRPARPYTVGSEYRLFVTNGVCARGAGAQVGAPLAKPLALPFIVTSAGGYIQSVSNVYHTLLTTITVTTSKAVHTVSIDGADMQYLGDNKFRLGIPGLAPGAIVSIKAYDGSGSLLAEQDYTVR